MAKKIVLKPPHMLAVVMFVAAGGGWPGLTAGIGTLLALAVFIGVHELGHFTVARALGIPVIDVHLTDGERSWSFKGSSGRTWYLGRSWTPDGGSITCPKLNPLSDRGWRKIVALAVAGPLTTITIVFVSAVLYFLSDSPTVREAAKICAAANIMLAVMGLKGDLHLAKVAHRQDRVELEKMYKEGLDMHNLA